MDTNNRLLDHEYEELSVLYEKEPPKLSGKPGFFTAMRERELIVRLLSPDYVRIVNMKARVMSMSPSEVIQYCIKEHMVGNA
jgi:hypothetical protein